MNPLVEESQMHKKTVLAKLEAWYQRIFLCWFLVLIVPASIFYIVVHIRRMRYGLILAASITLAVLLFVPLFYLLIVGTCRSMERKVRCAYIVFVLLIGIMVGYAQAVDSSFGKAIPTLVAVLTLMHGLTAVLPTLYTRTFVDPSASSDTAVSRPIDFPAFLRRLLCLSTTSTSARTCVPSRDVSSKVPGKAVPHRACTADPLDLDYGAPNGAAILEQMTSYDRMITDLDEKRRNFTVDLLDERDMRSRLATIEALLGGAETVSEADIGANMLRELESLYRREEDMRARHHT